MWLNPVGTRDLSPCSLCPWVKHCFKWHSVKEPFVRFWSARLFSPTSSLYAKLAKPTSSRLKFYTSHRDLRVVLIVQFNIQHERQFRCFPQISNYTCISIFFFFPVMLFFLLIYPPPVGVFLHGFGVGRCHRLLFFFGSLLKISSRIVMVMACWYWILWGRHLLPLFCNLANDWFVPDFSCCEFFTAHYENKKRLITMQSKTITYDENTVTHRACSHHPINLYSRASILCPVNHEVVWIFDLFSGARLSSKEWQLWNAGVSIWGVCLQDLAMRLIRKTDTSQTVVDVWFGAETQ